MTVVLFFATAALAALLACVLTPVTRALALRVGAVDHPGVRKIHREAVPRLGGLAVILSVTTVLLAVQWISPAAAHRLPADLLRAVAIGVLPIVLVSLIDDVRSLRAAPKFLIHLAGATATVLLGVRLGSTIHLFGHAVHIGWLAVPISIIWLAGTSNAFNIVDGLDGLSAGLALISAISLAAVSLVTGTYEMATAAIILAGALAGFLPFNLYPAKVYLGDTGATTIGFFLGALTLRGGSTTSAGLAVILPIMVIGLPIAETILSMARRLVRKMQGNGHGILAADRDHIHHRLLALGYNHKRAVLTLYLVAVLLAGSAFISLFLNALNAAVLLGTLLIGAFVGVARLGYDEFAVVRNGTVLRMYNTPVLRKSLFAVFFDIGLIAASIYLAIILKYDDWTVHDHRAMALNLLALAPAAALALFGAMGIYRRSWSHATMEDLVRSSAAVVLSSAATLLISRFLFAAEVPLTFFVLYTLIALALINTSRASYRIFYHWNLRSNQQGEPVIIYGAGKAGGLAIREILTNVESGMTPIGFIDDDPQKMGRIFHGYPVLGNLSALESVIVDGKAKGVVVASQKIPIAKVRNAQEISEVNGGWLTHFEVNFIKRGNQKERTNRYRLIRTR